MSALPDPLTVALAKKIEERDPTMTVVSLGEISELAFPEGDSTVEQLTDPERRTRLCSEAGLAYFVLMGELTSRELSKHGGFIPFLGAGTSTEATGLSAGIVDLERGHLLTSVSAVTNAGHSASGGHAHPQCRARGHGLRPAVRRAKQSSLILCWKTPLGREAPRE